MTALGDSTPTKTCTKCGECKTLSDFGWNNKAKKILRPDCKACKKIANTAYQQKNKTAVAAAKSAWLEANSEKMRAYYADYYRENKEAISVRRSAHQKKNLDSVRVANAEWRKNNPEKVKAQRVAWSAGNREKMRASEALWRVKNPEKRLLISRRNQQNRRAMKKVGGGRLSRGIVARLHELQRGMCACCGELLNGIYHIDHVMPLALGGLHDDLNVQLLLPDCNQKKKAQHPIDYMQSKGFLL